MFFFLGWLAGTVSGAAVGGKWRKSEPGRRVYRRDRRRLSTVGSVRPYGHPRICPVRDSLHAFPCHSSGPVPVSGTRSCRHPPALPLLPATLKCTLRTWPCQSQCPSLNLSAHTVPAMKAVQTPFSDAPGCETAYFPKSWPDSWVSGCLQLSNKPSNCHGVQTFRVQEGWGPGGRSSRVNWYLASESGGWQVLYSTRHPKNSDILI